MINELYVSVILHFLFLIHIFVKSLRFCLIALVQYKKLHILVSTELMLFDNKPQKISNNLTLL